MSMLFSTIALLLTQKPFHLSDVMVGLVTLVGVLVRCRLRLLANGRIAAISRSNLDWLFNFGRKLAILYFGGVSLLSYILGYALINLGLAITHSCNQNVIFACARMPNHA